MTTWDLIFLLNVIEGNDPPSPKNSGIMGWFEGNYELQPYDMHYISILLNDILKGMIRLGKYRSVKVFIEEYGSLPSLPIEVFDYLTNKDRVKLGLLPQAYAIRSTIPDMSYNHPIYAQTGDLRSPPEDYVSLIVDHINLVVRIDDLGLMGRTKKVIRKSLDNAKRLGYNGWVYVVENSDGYKRNMAVIDEISGRYLADYLSGINLNISS